MSCEDKNANIDDAVSEINKDLKLDKLSQKEIDKILSSNPNLSELIEEEMLCDLPSDPVFSSSQLDVLKCDNLSELINGASNQLPDLNNVKLNLNTNPIESDAGEKCEESLKKAKVILDIELKEYTELNILLQKLEEYRYNYKTFASYYIERLTETNRLINLFQPVLEIIKGYENEIEELELEISDLKNNSDEGDSTTNDLITSKQSEIDDLNIKIDEQQESIDTLTDEDSILSDTDLQNSASSLLSPSSVGISTTDASAANYVLDSEGGADTINTILQSYSSAIEIESNIFFGSQTSLISNASFTFNLDFVGIDFIQSQEDVYNEKSGKRNTRDINFPIKTNSRLNENNFFENTTGLEIRNESIGTEFTGKLYTDYYNKLSDPINELFNLTERGLTNEATLVDPNLKGTGLSKKKEASQEFFIRDQKKLEDFYQNLEEKIEIKKQIILRDTVDPSFEAVDFALKSLANAEVRMLLAIGGINQSLIEEDSNLSSIIETIQQSQQNFATKNANLNSEIKRIKARLKEIKPTPDRVKEVLVEIDSKCFSIKDPDSSPQDLESKVDDIQGSDPFGEKSLSETDPTMPSPLDLKYWFQFAKILNKVALLPLPKNPITLRYWSVGLFFPTPAGKIIKIPLPIIWVPLVVIPSPTGVIVIFLTINGLFISPIIFKVDSTGNKQHLLTAKGPSPQFGYTDDSVKSTIKIPLNIISIKDANITSGQGGLNSLKGDQKEEVESELESLNERLSRVRKGSVRYNKIQKKIDNINKSISGESESQKLQENLDKEESALDAIEKAKQSVKDRMDQLGEPSFTNSLSIQQQIQSDRDEIKKQIDEVYRSKMKPKEKRKKLKELRKKMSKENVSMSRKKEALTKDFLEFFDKIKLPTIKIPRDSTKSSPAQSPAATLKEASEEQLSNLKNDPTAESNKNVKSSMKRELDSVLDIIDLDDIPTNNDGKIEVARNEKKIKAKLKEITASLISKLKGESNENPDLLKEEISNLEKNIASIQGQGSQQNKKKRKLKKELSKKNAILGNYNETQQLKKDNSMTPEKLKEVSDVKFSFNAFKSLTELLPINVDFSPSDSTLVPFSLAKQELDSYIGGLSKNKLIDTFGGRSEISPNSIKDLYLNIINDQVSEDLTLSNKIDQNDILSVSTGVISSLNLPSKPSSFLEAFTIDKKIPIDLNLLIGPLKNILTQNMDDLIMCLPVDVENNFNTLNSSDIKSELQSKTLSSLDSLIGLIEPFYSIISLLKSTKGISLTKSQISSYASLPFGPIDFAKFTANALTKINGSASADTITFNLDALNFASSLIKPTVSPIMDNSSSYVISASAAALGLSETQRLLHPVLNSDDIPPWERLSSKNFLFVLFLDEFLYEAAEKVGFYRSFL